jgi:hypothetical protein
VSVSLNFPASPIQGQVFTAQGATFVFNGGTWMILAGNLFPFATQAEALAGTRRDVAMSPLRLQQAIDARNFEGNVDSIAGIPVNVVAQRAVNVDYQNTTGKALLVMPLLRHTTSLESFLRIGPSAPLAVARDMVRISTSGSNLQVGLQGIVPVNHFYRVNAPAGVSPDAWLEYQ